MHIKMQKKIYLTAKFSWKIWDCINDDDRETINYSPFECDCEWLATEQRAVEIKSLTYCGQVYATRRKMIVYSNKIHLWNLIKRAIWWSSF